MTDTEAALAGWRQRALDAEGLVDTYRKERQSDADDLHKLQTAYDELYRELMQQQISASYLAGKLAAVDTERLNARAWARSWKRLAKEYYTAYDEACDDEAAAAIVGDARIAALEADNARMVAALIRWRDADGTTDFPDADEELATIARGLGNE